MARRSAGSQEVRLEGRNGVPEPVPDRDQRLAVVRDRLARGFYGTEWVMRQVAVRLLASGDLDEAA